MNRKSILKLLVSMLLLSMLGIQLITPVRTTMTRSAAIDLYTQKEDPHSGKGPNQPSGPFKPHEEVILYAYVTNNSNAVPNKIVAFEIHGPPNSMYNITIVRTASTNASGLATTNFRIPWISENPEITIGMWSAYASVQIAEEKVEDTLTFRVGLIVDDDGPADFHTIQEAINNATDGDTIFVKAGTYYEHVVVNKSVTLIGENESTTIIDGNGTGNLVLLEGADNITVTGFTVRNASIAFYILGFNHTIIRNIISNNAYHGIDLVGRNNRISENTITNNRYGIIFGASSYNIISRNTIMSNQGGINLGEDCENNDITKNTLMNNTIGIGIAGNNNRVVGNTIKENWSGIEIAGTNNTIYHNNFINNTRQVSILESSDNSWDDGYPSGGNYWSDHVCVGNPSDGSQPYIIDENNVDHYPFEDPNGWISQCTLTIYSSPPGVSFTVDGVSYTTPWSGIYTEGTSVSVVMPETHMGYIVPYIVPYDLYVWSHWLEDGDTNRTKTFALTTNTTWTGVFRFIADINGNGVVDIFDVVICALAFGSKPEDPNWNPLVDLNQDRIIDIFDFVIIAVNFGKTDC